MIVPKVCAELFLLSVGLVHLLTLLGLGELSQALDEHECFGFICFGLVLRGEFQFIFTRCLGKCYSGNTLKLDLKSFGLPRPHEVDLNVLMKARVSF